MATSKPGTRLNSRGGVKSCLRALDVIEYFTRTGAPARTMEISEALGIPNSSTDEILRTLATTGHLSFNRVTKHYAPSYKLVIAARGIEQQFFGGEQLPALLDEIRIETGATVFLTVQNDCWIESVAELRGGWWRPMEEVEFPTEIIHFQRDQWRPGTNFAAAMLAQQSNTEIVELAARAQKLGLGPAGPTLMKTLVDRIARTRAKGFASVRRSETIRVDSLAVPLHLHRTVCPYAVGIVGDALFASDGDVKRLAGALRHLVLRRTSPAALRAASHYH